MTTRCDKCGKEIKDKWMGKRVDGDNVYCKGCMEDEIFDKQNKS